LTHCCNASPRAFKASHDLLVNQDRKGALLEELVRHSSSISCYSLHAMIDRVAIQRLPSRVAGARTSAVQRHSTTSLPAGRESAPYFEALVASSCRASPRIFAASGLTTTDGPLISTQPISPSENGRNCCQNLRSMLVQRTKGMRRAIRAFPLPPAFAKSWGRPSLSAGVPSLGMNGEPP
jgi:hypothetical protein